MGLEAIQFPIKWNPRMCRVCGRVKKNPCGMDDCPLFKRKTLVRIDEKEVDKLNKIGIDLYAIIRDK